MTGDLDARLRAAIAPDRVRRHAPLAPLTTFKVGGSADWLIDVRSADEARAVLTLAKEAQVPVCPLGGGSNVLISDRGIRGIVLRFRGGDVTRIDDRHIRADSGMTINGLVRWTITHGAAGLEAWAGTPGTVGGAIYGNAHFKGRLIGELVTSALLASRAGDLLQVSGADMEFGYDFSRLHRTGEMVVSADLRVTSGDPAALRAVARESLAFRKHTQPLESASAGCIFQNPNPAIDNVPAGIPPSAGALVDRAGLKGAREGHALVSPTHGTFIVNEGGATAADIRRLIARCKAEVHDRFGVDLREEIVYLGED